MKSVIFVCFIGLCVSQQTDEDPAEIVKGLKSKVAELNTEVAHQQADIASLTNKLAVIVQRLDGVGTAPISTIGAVSLIASASANKPITKDEKFEWDFLGGFLSSISMIIVSELGDKTFFIAAIMAMRHSRSVIFFSAILALAVMTVLSAAMGFALPNLLPRKYTHYAATGLFVFFGLRLLYDAFSMQHEEENEEMKEVEEELAAKKKQSDDDALEGGGKKSKPFLRNFFSPVFITCFTMTFLAEWGDRSQIATIALAAHKDPVGVTVGGIIGHALCTSLAVVGGKLLATSISERAVATVGGILFLIFAGHSLYVGV